jgi:integrase
MLYNLLREYRQELLRNYSPATAETYYKRLAILFEGQRVSDTVGKLDVQLVLVKLSELKYKNHFSQSKNAFLHFCEFQNIMLSDETMVRIDELGQTAKKKHRKLKPVAYTQIDSKIKHFSNMKLKLSFQTITATGLRVSELAGLSPNDCNVSKDSIVFCFIGKGSKDGTVAVNADDSPLLYERIKGLIVDTPPNKKVFYSAVYLQKKAHKLGFGCHNLRRLFAKLEYRKCRNKAEVSEKLRHSNKRTTNIYLKSKVKT